MSQQKRMTASDLGSLFGGKRTSTPKQVPGFKKKSDEAASLPISSAPDPLQQQETSSSVIPHELQAPSAQETSSSVIPHELQAPSPEQQPPIVTSVMIETATATTEPILVPETPFKAKTVDVSASVEFTPEPAVVQAVAQSEPEPAVVQAVAQSEPKSTVVQAEPAVVQMVSEPEPAVVQMVSEPEPAVVQMVSEPEPVVVQMVSEPEPVVVQPVLKPESVVIQMVSEPEPVVVQPVAKPEPVVREKKSSTVSVEEFQPTVVTQEKRPIVSVDDVHVQATQEVIQAMPMVEERAADTAISETGIPVIAVKDHTTAYTPVSFSTQHDIGHHPISVATTPVMDQELSSPEFRAAEMRPHPTNGSKQGQDTVPHVHAYPGNGHPGTAAIPPHIPGYFDRGGFVGTQGGYLPGNGYPMFMNTEHGVPAYSHPMYGMPTFAHNMSGMPVLSESSVPTHGGYVWIPGHPHPVFVGTPKAMEPMQNPVESMQNPVLKQGQDVQTSFSVSTVSTTISAPPVTSASTPNIQAIAEPQGVEKTPEPVTLALLTVEQEEEITQESKESEMVTVPNVSSPEPTISQKQWDGPLGRQMNQFANNQQNKWHEAQERMRVLARKRQFGFLAPSALLNLMESVAVLWRQETEERMTSKEMFIEGGLMMVETRLQALRSYGFPEEQLQALEQKMEQIKGVIYPQNGSYGE